MQLEVGRLYEDADGCVGFCTKSGESAGEKMFALQFVVPEGATYPVVMRLYRGDGTSDELPAIVKMLWQLR